MSTAVQEKPVDNTPVVREPLNPTVRVGQMVQGFLEKRTLHLPADYSPENSLKEAWLVLQTVQDRDGKPALKICSQESIVNALLDMVIQGLDPAKKQCYFIVYGNSLTLQRSYFGDIALAQRVNPNLKIYSDVIYKGEDFAVAKELGRHGFVTVVAKHQMPFPRASKEIIGAYCGAVDQETGENLGIELMDWEQILTSWKKSKTYKPNGNSFHVEQPDQAAQRTVIRRYCKFIINSSSDAMLRESMRRQQDEEMRSGMSAELASNANGELLALPSAPITMEQPEPAAPAADPVAARSTRAAPAAQAPATLSGEPSLADLASDEDF